MQDAFGLNAAHLPLEGARRTTTYTNQRSGARLEGLGVSGSVRGRHGRPALPAGHRVGNKRRRRRSPRSVATSGGTPICQREQPEAEQVTRTQTGEDGVILRRTVMGRPHDQLEQWRSHQGGTTVYCPKCGIQIAAGASYCGSCGTKVGAQSQSGQVPLQMATPLASQPGSGTRSGRAMEDKEIAVPEAGCLGVGSSSCPSSSACGDRMGQRVRWTHPGRGHLHGWNLVACQQALSALGMLRSIRKELQSSLPRAG